MGGPVKKCQDVVVSGQKRESRCTDDVVACSRKIPYAKKQEKCATGSDDKAALAELNKLIAGICREAGGIENCSYRAEGGIRTASSGSAEVVEICQDVSYSGTRYTNYRGQDGELPVSNAVERCGEGKDETSARAELENEIKNVCNGISNCTFGKVGEPRIERYVPWYSKMWSAVFN